MVDYTSKLSIVHSGMHYCDHRKMDKLHVMNVTSIQHANNHNSHSAVIFYSLIIQQQISCKLPIPLASLIANFSLA